MRHHHGDKWRGACAIEAPFTLPDGSSRLAGGMLGEKVLTDTVDTEPVWSAVNKAEPTGERRVKLLDLGGKTFAAGVGEQRIYGHNVVKSGQVPPTTAGIDIGWNQVEGGACDCGSKGNGD
jgi:hypothetical protein